MEIKFGLTQKTLNELNRIFSKQVKIEKVVIYGSRAKGNFKKGSDIDLTVHGNELSIDDLLKLENDLEDLDLPYKIDLSLYHQIENSDLRDHIERIGSLIYQKN
ncbi:MAG: nucleotidyltransferase domain-containing protein [Bacteriovoracaceae bacterium]|nr:nucleotidyltransferase domain-containing protein [Bacteriovoracaceae bacterium]